MSDYIKRENAIEWFQSMLDHDASDYDIGVGGCIAAVKRRIPSEDVTPVRHGRWKPFDRTYGRTIFACSECGECTDVPTEMGEPIFGYCPNCGAKMDKENEQ